MTYSRTQGAQRLRKLLTADAIAARVKELAEQIRADYEGKPITILVVLKGAFVFAADLMRALEAPVRVEFTCVSSYGDSTCSSRQVKILYEPQSLKGRDVLVTDDIADTGYTLDCVARRARELGARSVRICVLLDKPSRREIDVAIDYKGFTIPDVFVAGYGVDLAGEYRELREIYVAVEDGEADAG